MSLGPGEEIWKSIPNGYDTLRKEKWINGNTTLCFLAAWVILMDIKLDTVNFCDKYAKYVNFYMLLLQMHFVNTATETS